MSRFLSLALFAALSIGLAACGSDEDSSEPRTEVETSTIDSEVEDLASCFVDGGSPVANPYVPGEGTGFPTLEDLGQGVALRGLKGEKVGVFPFERAALAKQFIGEVGAAAKNNRLLIADDGKTVLHVQGKKALADETLAMIGDCLPKAPVTAQKKAAPADKYVLPAKAERTLDEQGRSGARAGLGDSELLPSEDGAKRLVKAGAIDEDAFCEADAEAFKTETLIEAERAFTRGWTDEGGDKVNGGAIYNALSVSCIA